MLARLSLVPLALAACGSLDPAPPHAIANANGGFSASYDHTAVVTTPDPALPDNVTFEGEEIPAPVGEGDVSLLDLPLAVDVALGRRHGCVLSPTGSVHCWGDHEGGALGEGRACLPPEVEGGTPDCVLNAQIMGTLPPARAIAAGDDVTCAITEADDRVVCWGTNARTGGSRLPALDPPTPVMLPGGAPLAAARVIIQEGTVCAIDHAQALWCWGDRFGALPRQQPQTGVVDVAFGRRHSCIIDAGGLRCTGENRNGQLGDVEHARRCGDGPCVLEDVRLDLDATRVVVGERHTCVLDRERRVSCFGSNEVGQLGRDDAFLVGAPGVVLEGVTELQSGHTHVCARQLDRTVWCWGATNVSLSSEETP